MQYMQFKGKVFDCLRKCSQPMSTVAGAALILAVAGLVSRLFGLLRDRILASTFGAGNVLDVYYASFRIPDLIYGLLVLGALSAAFIPIFTKTQKRSEEESWRLTSDFLMLLVGIMAIVGIVIAIFMPYLVYAIAPGFDEERREMVVLFTRIMLLSPVLLGASAVFGGVLVGKKSFISYSLAPIFYNIGIIFGATVLVDILGTVGLAWGVLVGAFMHLLIQFIGAIWNGFSFIVSPTLPWRNPHVMKILRLMGPQMFSVASNQINFWIITLFASIMTAGSLAVFNFANNLQSIPLALIGISFAVAAFPRLSSAVADGDMEEYIQTLVRTMGRILYFVIPASVFLILLRAQVVRVVLGTGVFDWEDTVLTYQVLGLLALSLFAQSLLPLLARAYYSLEDTRTPFFIALFSQTINVIVVAITFQMWGVYALAGAFSLSSVIQIALMIWFLRQRLGRLSNGKLQQSVFRILLATFSAGIAIQVMKLYWGNVTDLDTFWEVSAQLFFAGSAGIVVYVWMSHVLVIDEFCDFRKKVYIRLFGRPKTLAMTREGRDLENL